MSSSQDGHVGVVLVTQLVQLFVTPWTVAYHVPLSMGFPGQEYWNDLSFCTPGDLPNPGIKPMPLTSPALADKFFTAVSPGMPSYFSIPLLILLQFY